MLGGSSGSINVERARLFAGHGATAMALRWFGGEGQIPGICEVPLESFGLDGLGWPLRSSWTLRGKPLPFVAYDVSRMPMPQDGLMHYRAYHERSLMAFADAIPAASIPVEASRATFVLVAGADDALWPSDRFAASLAARLAAAGNRYFLLTHPRAGHRILLPGETAARSRINAQGGTDEADRELGRKAWKVIANVCSLTNE